jgi:hypothetical protein
VALPSGKLVQSGELGVMNADSGVVMQMTLPTLELVEGDTVKGQLVVEPAETIDAREIRVELMREERVKIGDGVNVWKSSMQRVQVAESPRLVPGTPVTYDFELVVPAAGSPTHDVGDTAITWSLVGTIDRPLQGDYTVTRGVGVYNGW